MDVLERASGKFLHLMDQDLPNGSYIVATSFTETPDGSVWVGTPNGLMRFRWKNEKVAPFLGGRGGSSSLEAYATVEIMSQGAKPGKTIFHSLLPQPDGRLLVSMVNDGIYKFNPADKTLNPAYPELHNASFFETAPGRIWVTSEKKVYFIENGALRMISFGNKSPNNTFSLFSDGNGNLIWACSPNLKSSFYSSPEAEVVRNGSVGQPSLVFELDRYSPSSFIDRSGNLWLGTSGYGLRKTHLARQPFQHFLPGVSVMWIFAGQKNYVFPHTDTGFGRLADIKNEAAEALEFSSGLEVLSLFYAKNGVAYFIASDLKDIY